MNPQKDELNPPYDPKPKTLAEAIAANETDPFFKELVEETDKIIDAHNMAAKTAKIAEQTFTPALGGGKERSVTYQTKLCRTAGTKRPISESRRLRLQLHLLEYSSKKGFHNALQTEPEKPHSKISAKVIERGLLEISESETQYPKLKSSIPS